MIYGPIGEVVDLGVFAGDVAPGEVATGGHQHGQLVAGGAGRQRRRSRRPMLMTTPAELNTTRRTWPRMTPLARAASGVERGPGRWFRSAARTGRGRARSVGSGIRPWPASASSRVRWSTTMLTSGVGRSSRRPAQLTERRKIAVRGRRSGVGRRCGDAWTARWRPRRGVGCVRRRRLGTRPRPHG